MSSAIVVNLTRFGDLIQSQAVIDDLHQAGYSTNLVCQNNFASALPVIRNLASAWLLPGAQLLSRLNTDWSAAAAELLTFAKEARDATQPDVILNLTPTLPARLLTSMLAGPKTKLSGFGLDNFGFGVNHGVWASFFSVAAAKRANSPFNLADLMRRMALPVTKKMQGSFRLAPPDPGACNWSKSFLRKTPAANGYITFQLGASQSDRRWPVANFRELGEIIWRETGLVPILLGTEAERQLGIEYATRCTHPFIDAIGKTDIPTLGALLAESRLLVTNDTGTMHLAAGLGKPVLAIFLATAQPWDTGPLIPGSCSLEPALDCHPCSFSLSCPHANKCSTHLSPVLISKYALAMLRESSLHEIGDDTVRAWLTVQDPMGMTNLEPLQSAQTGPGIALAWQRTFWLTVLEDLENLHETPAETLKTMYGRLPKMPDAPALAQALEQAANLMAGVGELGQAATVNPKMGASLLRNAERLQTLLDSSGCDALACFWKEFRLNQGDDLYRLGIQTGILAKHVKALAELMA